MVLYQILMAILLPAALVHAAITGGARSLRERLGVTSAPRPGPRLWLHAASNGEVTSAKALIEALVSARPGLSVLITCNSLTGRDLIESWQMSGVSAALAPLDTGGAAARLLDRFQPQALVNVENELWPSRIAAAHRRGVPILVIGARMSQKSAARWGALLPGLMRNLLECVDWLSPQDEASAKYFVRLGLPASALGPTVTLKAQVSTTARPAPFAAPAPRASVMLAASTHPGEEAPVLAAFEEARGKGGPAFAIFAPRHARRGDEVAALIAASGMPFARRSAGQVPGPETLVFLADTMGEMPLWYAMAGICVIGGSFADHGGHTPFEPAFAGCALIHGPSVANFAPQFAALDKAGGAIALQGLEALSSSLSALTTDQQVRLAATGRATLARFAVGSDAVAARILEALPAPLRGQD